jgi:hypothetical protein
MTATTNTLASAIAPEDFNITAEVGQDVHFLVTVSGEPWRITANREETSAFAHRLLQDLGEEDVPAPRLAEHVGEYFQNRVSKVVVRIVDEPVEEGQTPGFDYATGVGVDGLRITIYNDPIDLLPYWAPVEVKTREVWYVTDTE